MEQPFGLYLHVPFCEKKCSYCDFYSLTDLSVREAYEKALLRSLRNWGERLQRPATSLYLGGGTPSLLGGAAIARIINEAKRWFVLDDAEITLECNPAGDLPQVLTAAAKAGTNRVSMGLQAYDDSTLAELGRIHKAADAQSGIRAAQNAGITNISLDVMLALPNQTKEQLAKTIDFCAASGATHVSAYLLKVEKGTPLYRQNPTLPDEDETAELYEYACQRLEEQGFFQYEISNFAKPNYHSRHNCLYWDDGEYLGLGPAAHSFVNGKRFYYPRDLAAFCREIEPIADGDGGQPEEYCMLRLRLREGLTESGFSSRFGIPIPSQLRIKATVMEQKGLAICDEKGVRLTRKGMLVQNAALGYLLSDVSF